MKIIKNVSVLGPISMKDASTYNPTYVKEYKKNGYADSPFYKNLEKAKRGDIVMVYNRQSKSFEIVKVSSVGTDMIGEPKVRVTNGEYSWRTEDFAVSGVVPKF